MYNVRRRRLIMYKRDENENDKQKFFLIRENDCTVYRTQLIGFQHGFLHFNEYMFRRDNAQEVHVIV